MDPSRRPEIPALGFQASIWLYGWLVYRWRKLPLILPFRSIFHHFSSCYIHFTIYFLLLNCSTFWCPGKSKMAVGIFPLRFPQRKLIQVGEFSNDSWLISSIFKKGGWPQGGAPKLAKLDYNSNNYGLWLIHWYIYTYWDYNPTYNWGGTTLQGRTFFSNEILGSPSWTLRHMSCVASMFEVERIFFGITAASSADVFVGAGEVEFWLWYGDIIDKWWLMGSYYYINEYDVHIFGTIQCKSFLFPVVKHVKMSTFRSMATSGISMQWPRLTKQDGKSHVITIFQYVSQYSFHQWLTPMGATAITDYLSSLVSLIDIHHLCKLIIIIIDSNFYYSLILVIDIHQMSYPMLIAVSENPILVALFLSLVFYSILLCVFGHFFIYLEP